MKLHFLQAARAIAAWLVVTDHALLELPGNGPGSQLTEWAWSLGAAGVNMFFTISGFIMVMISWGSFGERGAAADFLRRRIIRIVPLYWLGTIAAFIAHKIWDTHGAGASVTELFYSLFFVPYYSSEDGWHPILPGGWTLNYEMMFYLVFAVGLTLPRKYALPAVVGALGAFVAMGPYFPAGSLAYLANPIVLWFLFGMALAVIWRWAGLGEPAWIARSTKALEPFGDASYSTYLIHGLVLTVFLRIWILVIGAPSPWIVPASLVAATLVGLVVYTFVETPMLRLLTHSRSPKREAALVHSGTT